jgi:hypothetical protein
MHNTCDSTASSESTAQKPHVQQMVLGPYDRWSGVGPDEGCSSMPHDRALVTSKS